LLDEVDKMSADFRGDPAAALLEVLDPEQNSAFNDHYLDLDYDLSDVMFITTANTLGGIPVPLQDRMEIIQLSGYTEFEKLNIAVKYLVPRQRKECGLEGVEGHVTDGALRTTINHYTREAGVRSLEREIGSPLPQDRPQVLAEGTRPEDVVDVPETSEVPRRAEIPAVGRKKEHDEVGLTNGLAVTQYGGDLLACEVSVCPARASCSSRASSAT
jgi:ATP-dependent Lon protease